MSSFHHSLSISSSVQFLQFSSNMTASMTKASTTLEEILLFCSRYRCRAATLVTIQSESAPPPFLMRINYIYNASRPHYERQFSNSCEARQQIRNRPPTPAPGGWWPFLRGPVVLACVGVVWRVFFGFSNTYLLWLFSNFSILLFVFVLNRWKAVPVVQVPPHHWA